MNLRLLLITAFVALEGCTSTAVTHNGSHDSAPQKTTEKADAKPQVGGTATAETSKSSEIVVMGEFRTTVRKQLTQRGILDALRSATSVSVQMIEFSGGRGGKLREDALKPISPAVTLTHEQQLSMVSMLSDDVEYRESFANCDCNFDPQMRVAFDAGTPRRHYDILLSGLSHGEIEAYVDAQATSFARTWTFIPQYLALIQSLFPNHEELPRLRDMQAKRLQFFEADIKPTPRTTASSP